MANIFYRHPYRCAATVRALASRTRRVVDGLQQRLMSPLPMSTLVTDEVRDIVRGAGDIAHQVAIPAQAAGSAER